MPRKPRANGRFLALGGAESDEKKGFSSTPDRRRCRRPPIDAPTFFAPRIRAAARTLASCLFLLDGCPVACLELPVMRFSDRDTRQSRRRLERRTMASAIKTRAEKGRSSSDVGSSLTSLSLFTQLATSSLSLLPAPSPSKQVSPRALWSKENSQIFQLPIRLSRWATPTSGTRTTTTTPRGAARAASAATTGASCASTGSTCAGSASAPPRPRWGSSSTVRCVRKGRDP